MLGQLLFPPDMAHHVSPAPTAEPAPPDASGLLAVDATRNALLDSLEARTRDFVEFLPGFRLRRAFSDGAWVVGAHFGRNGIGGRAFSRLDFEVRFHDGVTRVALVARSTVRDRDVDRSELDPVPFGDASIARFVERELLAFADRYFDRS